MDLIVTHNNADFDALSAAIAARKLYPDAKILLPGSQEESVRYFLSLWKDRVEIESEKTCDFSNVEKLIIVDTAQPSRIGKARELLNKNIPIHIYDHHPRTKEDIKGDLEVRQEVGATVTMLLEILKKRKSFQLTPIEATIMLLGIYEETGSLTYSATKKVDVDQVSFLLGCGANLQAVSSYLNRELTEAELSFLIELINKTHTHHINGINIAMAEIKVNKVIGELGTLVHKLQELENHPVLFIFFKRTNYLRIIARSREPKVDVNKILKSLGGGGHSSAATAKIYNADTKAIKEKILRILKTKIKVKIYAKDIMTSPVKTISVNKRINQAKKLFDRLRIKGAPCMEAGKMAGFIAYHDLNKAIKHGFGHSRVKGYMQSRVISIKENTPLHIIQKIMFENNIGRLPVLKEKRVAGIVSRTDVLKRVHGDLFAKGKFNAAKKREIMLNLSGKMRSLLPKEIMGFLKLISSLSRKKGYSAFVVGGFVRDIILGVKNFDIDIVLEGDAIEFGKLLAGKLKGSLVIHRKFGTSTVVIDWPKGLKKPILAGPKLKIDLATARRETYERPAALPKVQFSSLKNDLMRRDFSINAMAVSLSNKDFGGLIDFFGGIEDLRKKKIRVLHEASFIDDPTRIFRAVRFEQRYSFKIDNYTERLIKDAVKEKMFKKTQNQRIRDELILILKEDNPLKALKRMKELHELRFIHKRITLTKNKEKLFKMFFKAHRWYNKKPFKKRHIDLYLMYLMGLFDNLTLAELEEVCAKYVFKRGDRIRLFSCKKNFKKILRILSSPKRLSASKVYRVLEPFSYEVILFVLAKSAKAAIKMRISDFLEKYNGARIKSSGEDLKKAGLAEGPHFKEIMTKILYARLDGKIKTKKDELMYLKKIKGGK